MDSTGQVDQGVLVERRGHSKWARVHVINGLRVEGGASVGLQREHDGSGWAAVARVGWRI